MHVLLLGISSMLGRYMAQHMPEDVRLFGTYYQNTAPHELHSRENVGILRMDIKDARRVRRIFKMSSPDVVIHCASIGSVDYAEKHRELTDLVNVRGTQYVIAMCKQHGARLVFLSTNAVFSGENPPYGEPSLRTPMNYYGHSKALAENQVVRWMDTTKRLIVRPMLLYGWPWKGGRGNWATRTYESLQAEQSLRIVKDRVYQPTYAADLAAILWQMIEDNCVGTFHIAGPEKVSLYRFTRQVAEVLNGQSEPDITPIISSALLHTVTRPRDTTYSLAKMSKHGYHTRAIRAGLLAMKEESGDFSNDVYL